MNKNGGESRISDQERELLKTSFAENDELLKSIRKVFFQMELSKDDVKALKTIQNPGLLTLIRKIFMPEISATAPLGQNIDLWMTVDIKNRQPDDVLLELAGRAKLLEMIEIGLTRLSTLGNPTKTGIVSYVPNLIVKWFGRRKVAEDVTTDLISRNTLISHVEQQLIQIRVLAGAKKETVEETKTRLAKDATR